MSGCSICDCNFSDLQHRTWIQIWNESWRTYLSNFNIRSLVNHDYVLNLLLIFRVLHTWPKACIILEHTCEHVLLMFLACRMCLLFMGAKLLLRLRVLNCGSIRLIEDRLMKKNSDALFHIVEMVYDMGSESSRNFLSIFY